ncbi:MAG TPA: DUF1993 domain-containing protein [Rhodanobacteraceae bacterium]|jgi:hypothetical protein|nr:DUF1993 domain-containing protein [Rhodanobacteraceae bacterium]
MTISMYQASVPVFARALTNLAAVLKKGEAHAQTLNANADGLLQQRLIFDMLPLIKQIQIACDTATRGAARLAGVEPQPFPDTETTLAEAQDRIARAIAYINGFKPEQIDGSEAREVVMKTRHGDVNFLGQAYLTEYSLPNLFFHCATAYDILRVAGTQIGKKDFLGER